VAQKVVRDLATKKKIEIQYVDKAALEKLSGKKPHQVGILYGL
jgi:tRNA G18 (ribose-2'-O)-methylase SpoU